MAVGTSADYQACRELFEAIASRSFHVGSHGAGSRMKLVVNLVLGLNRAALPLSSAHDRLLSLAEDAGFADADNSAFLEAFGRRS